MSDYGSPGFYREQAARLTARAARLDDPLTRVQCRDIAKSFQMFADFAVLSRDEALKTGAA
jgi:hypothetical protein